MTDYFGIITKYFDGKQEFENGFLKKYFIGDTTVMWNSNDNNMYIGATCNSHWSFIYKAHYSRLYKVTGKLDSTDLDPSKLYIWTIFARLLLQAALPDCVLCTT